MHNTYESKLMQFDVKYKIVCKMNNDFDQKLKKYENEKSVEGESNLSRLITKLGDAYDELGEDSKKISKSREHAHFSLTSGIDIIESENNSYEVLKDILRSYSVANIGNGFFGLEKDEVEKFNLLNEFTQTLHGTQIRTAKSILSRIKSNVQSVDAGIQTSDNLISELNEMIEHLKQDSRDKDRRINQMNTENETILKRVHETQEKVEEERAKALSSSMKCEALEMAKAKIAKETQLFEGRLKYLEKEKLIKDKIQGEIDEIEAQAKEAQEKLLRKDSELRNLIEKVEDPNFILAKSKEIMKNPKVLSSFCDMLKQAPFYVRILDREATKTKTEGKDEEENVADIGTPGSKSKTTKDLVNEPLNKTSPSGSPKKGESYNGASDTSDGGIRDFMHSSYTRPKYQTKDSGKGTKGYESKFQVSDNNSEFGKEDSSSDSVRDGTRGRHKSLKPKERSPKKSSSTKKIRVGDQARFTNIKITKNGILNNKGGGSYPELVEDPAMDVFSGTHKQESFKSGAKPYNASIINKILKKGIHDRLFQNPNSKGSKRLSTVFDDKGIPHSEACGPNCRHLDFLNELNSKIPDGMYILKQTQHNFGANL